MAPRYSIEVKPSGFIRYTLEGLFDADSIAGFARDRAAEHANLACPRNAHHTLVDLTRFPLQPQDVTARFHQILGDAATRSARLAFVLGDSPVRMQVRRLIAGRNDVALFADEASAMAWLKMPAARAA
jgi:hypothetical protein